MLGLIAKDAEVTSTVCPSGFAFETISAPITPLAPGRLSTTTDWPKRPLSASLSWRATRSGAPPGENPTTMRSGRFEYVWLQEAVGAATASAAASAAARAGSRASGHRALADADPGAMGVG